MCTNCFTGSLYSSSNISYLIPNQLTKTLFKTLSDTDVSGPPEKFLKHLNAFLSYSQYHKDFFNGGPYEKNPKRPRPKFCTKLKHFYQLVVFLISGLRKCCNPPLKSLLFFVHFFLINCLLSVFSID